MNQVSPTPALDAGLAPTAVGCPPWCVRELGHPYEMLDAVDASESRFHGRTFGDHSSAETAFVDASALATWRRGAENLDAVLIAAWLDGNNVLDDLTPGRARALGELLVEAADWADSVASEWPETQR